MFHAGHNAFFSPIILLSISGLNPSQFPAKKISPTTKNQAQTAAAPWVEVKKWGLITIFFREKTATEQENNVPVVLRSNFVFVNVSQF